MNTAEAPRGEKEKIRTPAENLAEYLRAVSVFIGQGWSMEGFVLQHGEFMKAGPPVDRMHRAQMGDCYKGALEMAVSNSRYDYCEGYAVGIIPTLHGWCYDRETGLAADPTWGHRQDIVGEDVAYYGIRMRADFALAYGIRAGHYGILDDWQNNWPVLRSPAGWGDRRPADPNLELSLGRKQTA